MSPSCIAQAPVPADAAPGHECPNDPRHLVRQRHPHQHRWFARQHAAKPSARPGGGMGVPLDDDAVGTNDKQRPEGAPPIFVVAPRRCLPPAKCCRGTRPSHAAKSRALRKVSGGGARTAMAVAISGPMPGTVISRRATSFVFARPAISASSLPISASR